jgi:hypothetical protein
MTETAIGQVPPKESWSATNTSKDDKGDKLSRQVTNKRNVLTKLLPGYTPPLRLGGPLSTRASTTMFDLHHNALKEETKQTVNGIKAGQEAICFKTGRMLKCMNSSTVSSLGDGWFCFRPTPDSAELQADLALIRNRNYLDPKRFYKSSDVQSEKLKNMVQLGTVVEGAAEFYSARLTKNQKRSNFTEEVLADSSLSCYVQNKFEATQRQKTAESNRKGKRRKTGKTRY